MHDDGDGVEFECFKDSGAPSRSALFPSYPTRRLLCPRSSEFPSLPEKLWPFAVCKYRKFAPRTRTGTKGDEVGDMSSSSSSSAAAAAAAPRQTLLPFYVALPSSPGGNSTEGSHHGMKSQYISPIYAAGHLGCQGRTGHGNERVARISQRKKAACGQIVLVRSELREDGRVSGGEVDVMRM